jgi:cell pole-organizing protein PopZ
VTTEPSEQHEPSMEEILSSIRRIIADEEADDGNPEDDLGAAEARAEALNDDADAMAEAADDGDDVLELTKMVRDSGEVVDLRSEAAPDHEPVVAAEEPVEAPLAAEEAAPEPVEEAIELAPAAEIQAPAEVEALVETAPPEPEQEPEQEIELAPVVEAAPAPVIQAMPREGDQIQVETNQAAAELVSVTVATAATGAFAKLTQAVQRTPPEQAIADETGRSVEQFVEDMVRPILKEWLDAHLPAMVERLVEKEIKKIARRADLM